MTTTPAPVLEIVFIVQKVSVAFLVLDSSYGFTLDSSLWHTLDLTVTFSACCFTATASSPISLWAQIFAPSVA